MKKSAWAFAVSMFVLASGTVLAQDAAVGVGARPQAETRRMIDSPIAGKNVFLERPRGSWSRYVRDDAAGSAMKNMVERLGGLRVLDRREADVFMVGNFTVDLNRRQRKGGGGQIDLSSLTSKIGGLLGQVIPRRVDLDSRNETWDMSGEVDFDFATRGDGDQPSKVLLRMFGRVERQQVRSTDKQLRVSYRRWFSGGEFDFSTSNDTEAEFIAKGTLAGSFDNAEARYNPTVKRASKALPAVWVTERTLGVDAGDREVTDGQVVKILSNGFKVGEGYVSNISGSKVTIVVTELKVGLDVALEVEF